MEAKGIFVGIDVFKDRLDVAVHLTDVLPAGDVWEVSYDEFRMMQLLSRLKSLEVDIVLLEASGRLELPLVTALGTEEVPVVVVNPRLARDFARAIG